MRGWSALDAMPWRLEMTLSGWNQISLNKGMTNRKG
jgi:hypothetical protein